MVIRRTPEDFRVEEIAEGSFLAALVAAPGAGTGYAVYSLTKTSLTTPEAVNILAKTLGVRGGTVAYAGLKDKHAVTGQSISVKFESPKAAAGAPPVVEIRGLAATLRGWSARAIDAGDIRGNRFAVVVRQGEAKDMEEMDRRAEVLGSGGGALVFVNYFGDQRFGSARHGGGMVAKHLIKSEFEEALRLAIATPARKDTGARRTFTRELINAWGAWDQVLPKLPRCPQRAAIETLAAGKDFRAAFAALPNFEQRMFVDAYQSHLWNQIARRVAMRAGDAGAMIRVTEGFGEMVFPPAAAVTDAMRRIVIPLFSANTRLAEPWKAAAEETLREEGITVHDLRIPGLRRPDFGEAPRAWAAEATGFEMDPPAPDDLSPGRQRLKRTVRFVLPRGSYATVLLRALGQSG